MFIGSCRFFCILNFFCFFVCRIFPIAQILPFFIFYLFISLFRAGLKIIPFRALFSCRFRLPFIFLFYGFCLFFLTVFLRYLRFCHFFSIAVFILPFFLKKTAKKLPLAASAEVTNYVVHS